MRITAKFSAEIAIKPSESLSKTKKIKELSAKLGKMRKKDIVYALIRLCNVEVKVKVKVKQSRYSDPEGSRNLRFQDFVTSAQDGGKVVSLRHLPPLPPGNTPGTHFR